MFAADKETARVFQLNVTFEPFTFTPRFLRVRFTRFHTPTGRSTKARMKWKISAYCTFEFMIRTWI